MAYTFGATDLLATLGLTTTNFEIAGENKSDALDFVAQPDRFGDVIVEDAGHNAREEFTFDFKVKFDDVSPPTLTLILGGVGYGTAQADKVILTAVRVKANFKQFATLSITGHRHGNQSDTILHLARAYTVVTPTLGFGVLSAPFINGTIPEQIQNCEWSAQIEHIDDPDKDGDFLQGASTNCRLEGSADGTAESTVTIAAEATWKQDALDEKLVGGGYKTWAIKTHKTQAVDA